MRTTVWVIHWKRGPDSGVYKRVYEDEVLAKHILETLEDSNESVDIPFTFELLELEKVRLPEPSKPTMPEKRYGPGRDLPHAHLVGEPGTPLPVDKLTVRSINMLRVEEIETVEQLCCWREHELLRVPNLGRKSLNEIKEVLFSMGFKLKG